ncbi:caspase family protein [Streptomyces sp. 110]|uniref:Caspase family protein n=1 Tax=Streptomyces endocoffeicus TaxID=2898945 RepID=A0ABS1PK21_9ACTN|nr:caspase family protein [Streptomyces endocoffeicus]MBL1112761.1 caspase family protein [Streptomyces endocoffeicus]
MTAVEHDWRRTHAVIVAVEQYRGGDGWTLDGPVNDALAMRTWLTGLGVPAENIRLLASPTEGNKAAVEAADRDYRPADGPTIRQVFMEELRSLDADRLWIYWAGHGVQAPGGRWSLLYPETRDRDMRGLDALNLMTLLRTEHLPKSGMGRVTVIIDACWQALPLRTHLMVAEPETLTRKPVINKSREIYWMRACQPGAVSKNQQGAGLFTSVLLRQLEAASAGGVAPDLDRVWQGVRDEFARLGRDEGLRQFPTVHISRGDGNGEDVPLGRPRSPLDEQKRRERGKLIHAVGALLGERPGRAAEVVVGLWEQFTTEPPSTTPPSAEELVDWALENPHGTVTLLAELSDRAPVRPEISKACHALQNQWLTRAEYAELTGLLERLGQRGRCDLAEEARSLFGLVELPFHDPARLADALEELLPKPDRLPQLLRVVERFAAVDDGPVAAELRAWSLRCAERLGLKGQLMERRGEATEYAEALKANGLAQDQGAPPGGGRGSIQIRLHRSSGPGQLRGYEVWTRRGEDVHALAKVDTPASLDEIQDGLEALLSAQPYAPDTLLEFFVSATDLELAVHQWQFARPVKRHLGTDYPVVMRCTEFRESQRHDLWKRRWDRVGTAGTQELRWLPGHMDCGEVYRVVQQSMDTPGALTTTPSRARADLFNACLFGGVPVLIWHGEAEPSIAEDEIRELLGAERPLRSLPQRLRELRSDSDPYKSHHGSHMALLWDDPHRPLPDPLDLSAP